jgi:2-iminobutanoate/2-iminopropanoate deaminase
VQSASPEKVIVTSTHAPAAIGPYSQAIRVGNEVWCSGQIPLDPVTMTVVGESAAEQAEQVFANLRAVLAAADGDLGDVVKVTIFLVDLADFASVNEVYARHMPQPYPARSTIQVARLPRDVKVEIEAVARLGLRRP